MWRLNPSCTTSGQACVSGPKPFVVLTGPSTRLITPETWMKWKNRIEMQFPAKKTAFSFDLSKQLSANEIALLQSEWSGFPAVEEPEAREASTPSKETDVHETDPHPSSAESDVPSTEPSETPKIAHEETFWESFARKIIDPPFNHRHGVVAFSTSETDTLHEAARRFLAFLDASHIEWTHVISFGKESLLAAFLALHYPHRIGSLVIIDTPILPDCISQTTDSHTELSRVSPSSAPNPADNFLQHYPSSEQLKFMLHPILYITTEQSSKAAVSIIDRHKQAVNIKKVIKLKDIDSDALRNLVLGNQTFPVAAKSPSHIDAFCEALGKWHDRFDLMSYVNRRWASAKVEYFKDLEKHEVK
ncbi:hydrolase or acyltransferase of alpha/beta superfamily [Perkinsela sp. CCAP 1560/4]|nr:hydrolase or acyltransferase of alpha/beta superfamily [Perkinsela sp. CCAP 1560/4]|eukprot:KNH06799.1 hydrolase or acyltransferase of alpha/beta superfamily [Perkinsela sp. CCAP 1560/4]